MAQFLQNSMSRRYFSTQLNSLVIRGYKAEAALKILGLNSTQLSQPERRLPIKDVEAVYRDAAQTLQDELIALRVGRDFRVPNLGQTGAIYGFCADLSSVIEINRKYQKLAIDAAQISHDIEDGRHYLTLTPYETSQPAPYTLMMVMGAYASTFQWLTWTTSKEIKAAYFTGAAPENISIFTDVFRCPIYFEQERMRLEFFKETIHMPFPTANAEKLAAGIAKLDALLESQNTSESFSQAVHSATRAALNLGSVSLSIVASRLGISERQLRQKLKTINQNFRAILESERKAAFERLFKNGESFAVIAQSLGYNDQPAFNRAFKRWYDMSPSAYSAKNQDS